MSHKTVDGRHLDPNQKARAERAPNPAPTAPPRRRPTDTAPTPHHPLPPVSPGTPPHIVWNSFIFSTGANRVGGVRTTCNWINALERLARCRVAEVPNNSGTPVEAPGKRERTSCEQFSGLRPLCQS